MRTAGSGIGLAGEGAVTSSRLACRRAGVDRDTSDPPTARYTRDDDGELTGRLEESAALTAFALLQATLGADSPVRYRSMRVSTSHDDWMDSGLRPGHGDDFSSSTASGPGQTARTKRAPATHVSPTLAPSRWVRSATRPRSSAIPARLADLAPQRLERHSPRSVALRPGRREPHQDRRWWGPARPAQPVRRHESTTAHRLLGEAGFPAR